MINHQWHDARTPSSGSGIFFSRCILLTLPFVWFQLSLSSFTVSPSEGCYDAASSWQIYPYKPLSAASMNLIHLDPSFNQAASSVLSRLRYGSKWRTYRTGRVVLNGFRSLKYISYGICQIEPQVSSPG